ncbi:MAG: hypothetical protein WAU42_14300, partial [Solirubrobacteraceae bacterium]
LADARLSLGFCDVQPPRCEVHVSPAQGCQLADAQARKGQGAEDRPARRWAIRARLVVELAGGVRLSEVS